MRLVDWKTARKTRMNKCQPLHHQVLCQMSTEGYSATGHLQAPVVQPAPLEETLKETLEAVLPQV